MRKRTPKTPAATMSKDGVITTFSKTTAGNEKPLDLNSLGLPDVSGGIYQRIKNNEDITQLFPDVELSIQILSSSILSPNDMTTTSLIYNVEDIDIPNDVNTYIISEIKKHMNKEYKLVNKLPTMLKESLFTKGAYIEAIIPNEKITSITQSTNDVSGEVSLENLEEVVNNTEALGILSTEGVKLHDGITEDDLFLDINDNITNLVLPSKFMELTTESLRSSLVTDELSVEDRLYKKNAKVTKEASIVAIDSVPLTDSETLTKPTILKLPTVATIPVHMANDPEEHIGYFILLNDKGTPIVDGSGFKLTDEATNDALYASDVKSNIIKKAKQALHGITKEDPKLNDIEDAYVTLAKKMINEKISGGSYGESVEVIDEHELYKIMFHRALSNKKTKLLYVPKEYVSYMAFEYRDNGTGKSLIEKVAMLYSIRSILLISRLMANMKNSVTTTEVSATLSDNDPDPQGTMEKIISETLKSRQTRLPIGINKVDDLVDWANKVGFKYNIQGQGLPNMELSVEESSSDKVVPDDELDDKLQEYIIMSFGLTKDMVMAGYDPEYATIAISNNVLLAKRVMVYQDKFSEMLSDYASKILRNDGYIKTKVKSIISSNISTIKRMLIKTIVDEETKAYLENDENVINYVLNVYIKHLKVSFPRPEVNEATNMKDTLSTYTDTVDELLDILISSDSLPDELTGDMSNSIDDIKAAMKTMLIKEWAVNNNYVPEITNFLTLDNTGKPVFDILDDYSEYTDQLSTVLLKYFKKNKKQKDKVNDKLTKIEEGDDANDGSEDNSNYGDTGANDATDNTDDGNYSASGAGDNNGIPSDDNTVDNTEGDNNNEADGGKGGVEGDFKIEDV